MTVAKKQMVAAPVERIENMAMQLAWTVARAHAKGWLIDPPSEVVAAITAFREACERTATAGRRG